MSRARLYKLLFVTAAALAAALFVAACGSDEGGGGKFDIRADADTYAGPTPLTTRFTAESKNAKGDVIYRWRFDDGTSTEEQDPTHTFPRPGYYTVILDARDEDGNNDRQSFLLGAWPPGQWAKAQREPLTEKGARDAQRVQQRRTDERLKELRVKLRERARQQLEG